MAGFSFTAISDLFPVGTTVGAYLASGWHPTADLTGAPPGAAVTTAVVDATGALTFTGLADDTSYVAGAQVNGVWRYRRFRSRATTATVRRWKSGRYYSQDGGSRDTAVMGASTVAFAPLYVEDALTIDRLAIDVTVASTAGGKARLGIYNDDGTGYPNALLLDGGTVAADAAATPEATVGPYTLPRGLYWLAVRSDASATSPTVRRLTQPQPPSGSTSASGAAQGNLVGYAQGGLSAGDALPNPAPSGMNGAGRVPAVAFRAA